jgi:hypothetical protein
MALSGVYMHTQVHMYVYSGMQIPTGATVA